MTGRLDGKIALVTGAGGGIGRATALRFAAEGASLIVADLDETLIHKTAALITGSIAVTGDVSQRADCARIVETATKQFGRLDILVNNAGIMRDALTTRVKDGDVKMMSDDQWDAVLAVNLKGTWLMAQAAAVPMIAQKGGRITNTSSISANGNAGQANYAASKAGVIGLTRTLALEWARYHIGVNCVAPGAINTRMTAAIPEKVMEGLLARIPLARLGEPEEIAAAHVFLASADASYITGQVIWVDGGVSLG